MQTTLPFSHASRGYRDRERPRTYLTKGDFWIHLRTYSVLNLANTYSNIDPDKLLRGSLASDINSQLSIFEKWTS